MNNDKIYLPADSLQECPACGLLAAITDRFTLAGAPAPVEHVKITCVMRHWFTLPVEQLAAAPATDSGPAEAGVGRDLGERARR
jgi:hypothetical protein